MTCKGARQVKTENKIKNKSPSRFPKPVLIFAILQHRNTPLKANSVEVLCSLNIEILSDVETNSLNLYFNFYCLYPFAITTISRKQICSP